MCAMVQQGRKGVLTAETATGLGTRAEGEESREGEVRW